MDDGGFPNQPKTTVLQRFSPDECARECAASQAGRGLLAKETILRILTIEVALVCPIVRYAHVACAILTLDAACSGSFNSDLKA